MPLNRGCSLIVLSFMIALCFGVRVGCRHDACAAIRRTYSMYHAQNLPRGMGYTSLGMSRVVQDSKTTDVGSIASVSSSFRVRLMSSGEVR